MDFSGEAGKTSGNELIPAGTLAFVIINYREEKESQTGNGPYHDIELTIDDGQQFARRKIWHNMMDPERFQSDKARAMSQNALARILEAGRQASPANAAGYQLGHVREIHGLRVGIKIGIEKSKDNYPDKNKVQDWLTPNPDSASAAAWTQLCGEFQAFNQAGGPPVAAAPAQGAMPLAAPLAAPAPATPAPAAPAPVAPGAAPAAGAAPTWLAQANGPAAGQ